MPKIPTQRREAERFITDENGKRLSVIMSYRKYQRMVEDLHDLGVLVERRDDPTVSFEQFKEQLKADGLVAEARTK
jgi:hypothetical protein